MKVSETAAPNVDQQPERAKGQAPRSVDVPNAQPDPRRLAILLVQLAALLFVIKGMNLHRGASHLLPFSMCLYGFVAFVIHYWLPFHLKKLGFVLISLGGVFAAFGPYDWLAVGSPGYWGQVGAAAGFLAVLLAVGLLFFVVLAAPVSFWLRVAVLLAVGGVLTYGRANDLWLPVGQWRILGGIFIFRLIIYAKVVQVARQPEKLSDFMCYFFLLPNLFFALFPTIDYTTFKRGYYAKNIHESAQKGIFWMARGVSQVCLFRILYQREIASAEVEDIFTLVPFMFQLWLQYMGVSGLFHFIAGILHLFGWNLPETNRKYLLASSFTDFWRRANIYWKDFMVNIFYYPVYFRLHRYSEKLALTVATVTVFLVTVVLHAYQMFWIRKVFAIHTQDYVFWGAFGTVVLLTVLYEATRGRRKPRRGPVGFLIRGAQTIGVLTFVVVFWSIYSMDLYVWWDTVSYVFGR